MADTSIISSDQLQTGFVWDDFRINLLIEEYGKRADRFRNRETSCRQLWQEIATDFLSQQIEISPVTLQKKFANLKQTYRENKTATIKHPNRTIQWKYYEKMDIIMGDDFMSAYKNSTQQFQPLPLPEGNNDEDNYEDDEDDDVVELSKADEDNFDENIEVNPNDSDEDYEPSSPDAKRQKIADQKSSRKDDKQQSHYLFGHRKIILCMEEEKITEIRKLRIAIQESNKIQQQRNDILKKLVEREHRVAAFE